MANFELWPPVPVGAHEILPDRKCPRCGSTRTHRSRIRGPLERGMKTVTPLRPFSCSDCQWRGWRVPVASPGPKNDLPPAPSEQRRSRHRDGTGHAHRSARPDRIQRRARIQITLTVLLAIGVAFAMIRCQQGEVGAVTSGQ